MTSERRRQPSPPLTADSTGAEVLAAVAAQDRLEAELAAINEKVEFPEVPEGYVGCVASLCGNVIAMYGPINEDPVVAAQNRAGEEDQSQPGWDGA